MPSSFKSNDTNVSDILKSIANGNNQLPDFQRGWVWDDNRIKALVASISNSYPVEALMFLEYGGDSVRFKYRPFTGASATVKPEILVLDGQQRLTSIFGAMYCREAINTKTDKNKPIKRYYYLNIDMCLNSTTDRVDAIYSIPEDKMIRSDFGRKIDLDLSTRENEFKNHMFPLNIVYDLIKCNTWQNEYQVYHQYAPDVLQRYGRFIANVLVPIQTYKVPVITLDKSTPKEAVCQVFENVNTGGVSLTVFELITATFAADNFELRKDWEKRKEEFINKSALSVNNLNQAVLSVVSSTDFLTAITLLSRYYVKKNGGEAVSCKRKDVLALTLPDYLQYADQLSSGFLKAATFLKEQRIFSARDLPYSTQLIPMAVIFALLGDKTKDNTIKEKIARWYWCGVFGEMYGGANETRYANDVVGLMSWIEDNGNPPETVSRAYFNPTRLLTLQSRLSAAYKGVMALILGAGALDFISGSAMDFTVFLDENTDIHHIFPRAYCEDNNIPKEKWNSIVNKTPLFARTNRILGGSAPSHYLMQIEKNNRVSGTQLDIHVASHLIHISSIRSDNFQEFLIYRAKALLDIISQAMGKSITNRDSDEVVAAFGDSL
ncbi:hypothetical protein CACET_c12530 [Clostridium aceticum]|uniref:GmrSD restriction endonucleases N-terminal domain-containing protein n=1 Tax=Clostridium aceticum TaxID=84022 RepID=A0A0D8ICG6_9CLOT|nr:DUF262 domain-containing protein [Clostridium aceticum]AKL94718.1 hypothetical protein CACET_c12530 [Clostridium aceticum]KJF27677.1 hypothetical protein TZ02_03400 [Clostridium aceticum]